MQVRWSLSEAAPAGSRRHSGKNKERHMKSSLFFKIIIATLALMLAGSAFAGGRSHKDRFSISAPTTVNGQQLPAGEYEARWQGAGPTVQVSLSQGGKVLATVPAQLVELDRASLDTRAVIKSGANGDRELTALRFSGKTYSLNLGTESAKAESKSDSTN